MWQVETFFASDAKTEREAARLQRMDRAAGTHPDTRGSTILRQTGLLITGNFMDKFDTAEKIKRTAYKGFHFMKIN